MGSRLIHSLFILIVICNTVILWKYMSSLYPLSLRHRTQVHHGQQMVSEGNRDKKRMDNVHLQTSSEKTVINLSESDVKNDSMHNQVVRTIRIENDATKTIINKTKLNNSQQETMMIPSGRYTNIVQEGGKNIGEIYFNNVQNYTTNERKDRFVKKENVDITRKTDINRVPLTNADTIANKNVSCVQEEDINKLKGNFPFLLYETTTNSTRSLVQKIQKLQKDSQNDSYSKGNVDNSLLKDNRREISKFHEAKLIAVQEFDGQVLLYSAILSNSSESTRWDRLAIQGWEMVNLTNQSYLCCVLYPSRIIRVVQISMKIRRRFKVNLKAKQFICDLSHLNDMQKELPVSVTLISAGSQARCPARENMYVRIEYAYEHPGEFVIFAKIIYGNISTTDLLAWLEIHRRLGADKVVFYPFRLGQNVTKVLRYYQNLGFVEIVPFAFPTTDFYERDIELVNRGIPFFNHQDVAITDGLERLQGYKYIASFDTDEYLVPASNETLVSLFDRLCTKFPDAAGFIFGTYIYIINWGPASNESILLIGTYLYRTALTRDRNKHVVLPKRVTPGWFFTHSFFPREPFRRYRVLESEAAIHHYRGCRQHYMGSKTTCLKFKAYKDDFLYKAFKSLEKRVLRLKHHLGV